jgi:anti-sigma factor RsiW
MIGHDELMRYLDGELDSERSRAVEEALERSTELQREVAVFRRLKVDLNDLGASMDDRPTVWSEVSRRLTAPVGWALFLAGALVWVAYGVYTYLTGADALWEKVATSAVVVGLATLLLHAALDRLHDLKTDPYKELRR